MTHNVAAHNVASLYNAIMTYPWSAWNSLREAWVVAEHYKTTYSRNLKVYAALQTDAVFSEAAMMMVGGSVSLGGGKYLNIENGKPGDLPTTLWGDWGWSTWCYQIDAAIEEAAATNSIGSIAEEKPPFTWMIMELEIPLNKLPYLMEMGYITTGKLPKRGDRYGIYSIRMHDVVPGEWISSVSMVTK